jgi:glycerophosphoryl diester phosphodiesterase
VIVLIGWLGCGSSESIDVQLTVSGASLADPRATATYRPMSPIPFVHTGFMTTKTWEDNPPVVAIGDQVRVDHLAVHPWGPGEWALQHMRLGAGRCELFVTPTRRPTPTDPPPLGSTDIGGAGNPLEFASLEGGVARFSSSAAYMPLGIHIPAGELHRVEITLDPTPVPLLRLKERDLELAPDAVFTLPIGLEAEGGCPSERVPTGPQTQLGVLVIDEQQMLDDIGWKPKSRQFLLTPEELRTLRSHTSSLLQARVLEEGPTLEITAPSSARGKAALVVHATRPGSPGIGATYLLAEVIGQAPNPGLPVTPPLVLAHRGASGYLPDHTLEAYLLAIEQGADYIEPDLVSSKDGVLVVRHENELSGTTDVAERFADRRTKKVVDGKTVEGWFTEDFTLAELGTLRARQPLPSRPHDHDGKYTIPTFDEVLDLAARKGRELGRPIGVYPETKHPSYFDSLDLSLEEPLLRSLAAHGLTERDDAVFIQSFEPSNLQELRGLTRVRLVLLVDEPGIPVEQLPMVAGYADGIGVNKRLVITASGEVTPLVAEAHKAGLLVHAWTFRKEAQYLPPWAQGDPAAELRRFFAAGVDGVFADFPDLAVQAR